MIKLVSKKEEVKTALMVGSRVTFIGNLPGGQWDNYSGWSKVGSMFGTITKINKVNALITFITILVWGYFPTTNSVTSSGFIHFN